VSTPQTSSEACAFSDITVVVPTVGRPSLRVLLESLAHGTEPFTGDLVVVDDRRGGGGDDLRASLADLPLPGLRIVRSGGGGPARARNIGWRHARSTWVSFLDDDVVVDPDWLEHLRADLAGLDGTVAGSQGRVRVPLPTERRPTDWERGTAGLATARWITADLAYRRSALSSVGGFDERFPRAFREDADLGLRVTEICGRIAEGRRGITHPVRPSDDWASVRQQAGNADDILMRRLHGPDWRARAHAPQGRRTRHLLVAGLGVTAGAAALARRPGWSAVAAAGCLAGVAEFTWRRVQPGPRDAAELRRMLTTSAVIPFAATWHTLRGVWQHRAARSWRGVPDLVLFDRDGTLVRDVPYNGDPTKVSPVPGAAAALDRLRQVGVRVGVVTNQSGIASGRITTEQMHAVNAHIDSLLGPFEVWRHCPHARDAGCTCRKPAPGMVKDACDELDVDPSRCAVVGDIGSDVAAAEAAGARGILVPTEATRESEVAAADHVCADLPTAVEHLLAGRW